MKPTTASPDAARATPSRALFGYLLGGAVGLLVIGILARSLTAPPPAAPSSAPEPVAADADEVAHLAVLAEFDDLARPEVRTQLCELQRALAATEGLFVEGPLDFPIAVPPAERGGKSEAKALDALTPEELAAATPYFGVGGWLSPRLYAPDLKSAVLRVGIMPGKTVSRSAVAAKVREALADPRFGALRLCAYSRAFELGDDVARERLNRVFGVQLAVVEVHLQRRDAGKPDFQQQLLALSRSLEHPRVKSVATVGAFVHYAAAVAAGDPALAADAVQDGPWRRAFSSGRKTQRRLLISRDQDQALIVATTDAEGPDNREVTEALTRQASEKDRAVKLRPTYVARTPLRPGEQPVRPKRPGGPLQVPPGPPGGGSPFPPVAPEEPARPEPVGPPAPPR